MTTMTEPGPVGFASERGRQRRTRVVVAGGGFAALEFVLALKAMAPERADLTLISPTEQLDYRPMATVEPFRELPSCSYDLRAIARDLAVGYRRGRLRGVAAREQSVRLDSGARLEYDVLVLAVGARARAAVPGALTVRGQRDLPRLRALLGDVTTGAVRRLVFAVPSRDAWSLPAYEMALQTARHATCLGAELDVALLTPERIPLEVVGMRGSRIVADLLAERGISFLGNSTPRSVRRDGSLALQVGAPVAADRVVALPQLHGSRLPGLPAGWSGFVPTDAAGRVDGLANVYAAGDMTQFPVKQGGIAAQQADEIAHSIAADLGAPVKELHETRILRARLLHGDGAIVLRAELDAAGRATRATIEHRESRDAPDLKVFGRYLSPYLSIYRSRGAMHARA